MALTTTTLAVAMAAGDLKFKATSSTGATVGGLVRIDNEYMEIATVDTNGFVSVSRRGLQGSAVVAHNILASVVFGLTSDLVSLPLYQDIPVPLTEFDQVNIGANGAIACPVRNTQFWINKATALGSSTLAQPTADQDGLRVKFMSTTNAAHVVSVVTSFDGTTGTSTTYTFPAFAGAGFELIARGTNWYLQANNLVVVT
jgi:hypothetical protein